MSPDPFPERIDAVKLFARNGTIRARLPLARLTRLSALLADTSGEASVDLRFALDEEGKRRLQGTLSAPVTVECQRCLRPMPLHLQSTLALHVVEDEAALLELDKDDDAVAMTDGHLDLPALIEDELILSLPLVPMHEDTTCNAALATLKEAAASTDVKPNPFAILAGLKKDKQ